MAKLILTTSYFNTFPLLIETLKDGSNLLDNKRLIFCEEKISLMTERAVCSAFNGSFNTEVYSFGNFMRVKKPISNVLTLEGSSMVVRKILSSIQLDNLKQIKSDSANTFFNVIAQLKSSSISVEDLLNGASQLSGILKSKLCDVAKVYQEYQNYLKENSLEDQNSVFTYLPEIIKESKEIENSDVILFGLTSITSNAVETIKELLKKAKSVTAILTSGDNLNLYVNEVENIFKDVCKSLDIPLIVERRDEGLNAEAKIIAQNLFAPSAHKINRTQTDKISVYEAKNLYDEVEKVASIIKQKVMEEGARYKDFTLAVPDVALYEWDVKEIFTNLEIPFFLDDKISPVNHPLITLILSYVELLRGGLERYAVCNFVKNPLFEKDKSLSDAFENLLLKNNVNYSHIQKPFAFEVSQEIEDMRGKVSSIYEQGLKTNVVKAVRNMLDVLSVKDKLKDFSQALIDVGEREESAVNEQIFDAVDLIITQIELILREVKITPLEFRNIFLSGVTTLKLSIIPQYNDAVFIGGYKEAGLLKARYLFAMGLTAGVPSYSDDSALLSDADIAGLDNIKIKVEPTIKIVNRRTREGVGMGITAFRDQLFLSFPYSDENGKKISSSEIFEFAKKAFTCNELSGDIDFLYKKQGVKDFARQCGKIYSGELDVIERLSSFYWAVNEKEQNQTYKIQKDDYYSKDYLLDDVKFILEESNRKQKIKLEKNKEIIVKDLASPTTIENYFTCPYKAFLSNGLKVKERDKGEIDAPKIGTLIHEIFASYAKEILSVYNKESSDQLFEKIKTEVLKDEQFSRFLLEKETQYSIENALSACKKLCYNLYQQLSVSEFKPEASNIEVHFGDDKGYAYPAVSLLGGKVKLSGVIDRVDTYEDYCRVIDYKTGKIDPSDASLFVGIKLQLYLYSSSVRKIKKMAGAYYVKVADEFVKPEDLQKTLMQGKTLGEDRLVLAQDNTLLEKNSSDFIGVAKNKDGSYRKGTTVNAEEFNAYIDYAVKVSEKAVAQMTDGVIVASPYKGTCEYCDYASVCKKNSVSERTVNKVNTNIIVESVGGENTEDGN